MNDDTISRRAAIDALDEQIKFCDNALCDFNISLKDEYAVKVERASLCAYKEILEDLPPAQPEWNNHTVACMLAELFDDTCACNYNGIDEWLPEKCELLDSCQNPAGVACWEQFLKHRAERRTDEDD